MGNPKSEVRSPKEVRRPMAEGSRPPNPGRGPDSAVSGLWGEEVDGGVVDASRGAPKAATTASPDLLERTARFGEAIIRFARKVPQNPVNNRLIDQLVGAGTSVAANYCEADDAVSGKDFETRSGPAARSRRRPCCSCG